MNDRPFPAPVEIVLTQNTSELWLASGRAWSFCRSTAPAFPGPRYRAAVRICRDALDGWLPVVKARRAFVAAAREAHLLVKH